MLFETIKTEGLAHLSYLLGDGNSGTCAVIDPRRDVQVYLELAQRYQTLITHIIETHVHADFVSGSRELAARTGATIYTGVSSDISFDHTELREGEVLELGKLKLRVLHTPGHSPEHISLVVSGGGKGAEHAWAVFTGDTLFAGEVGRPDLSGEEYKDLAEQLFESLHDKLLKLGDGVEVYPAHGEGSPCGGNIGARDRTTIGYERRHNEKLQVGSKDGFIAKVLDELSEEPFYYQRMKQLNARGPKLLGAWPEVPALTPEDFQKEMQQPHTIVVDTREIAAFAGAHIEGSINIALRKAFPIWVGWLLNPEQRLLLVAEDAASVRTVQEHLLRTGYDNLIGYVRQGMRGWIEAGLPFCVVDELSVHDLKRETERGNSNLQIVDVRRDDEWEAGHVPKAQHIYLPFLEQHLDELDRERPVAVYCGSGYRASIAASLLKRHGFSDVKNVPGSVSAWKAAGYPLTFS